jgi:hypothetical protein
LKIKGPRGKYERAITLKKDETLDIRAKLNPSLAFLGIVAQPDVQQADLNRLTEETAKQLSLLENLNFVDNTGGMSAIQEKIRFLIESLRANEAGKDRKPVIQDLCARVESDLLLIGFSPKEQLQRTVDFYLLSNWSTMADLRTVQAFDPEQWKSFRRQLDYEEPLFQKRLGVTLIDTNITPGRRSLRC